MTTTCSIAPPGTTPVMDPETGEVTFPDGAAVYAGPCRVRPASGPGGSSGTAQVAGVELFRFDYLVSVPFSVAGVQERDRLKITASPDPALVGVELEVRHVDRGEHLSARRLQCQEVK